VVIAAPLVEELTFRGLGFSLLEPFGRWTAIIATGVLFGLSHGLLLELPIIAAFGCLLGWLRDRTGSVYPGIALHGAFNLFALIAAVTIGG
jgi:membrane protease YdiL (CAAX protease family)